MRRRTVSTMLAAAAAAGLSHAASVGLNFNGDDVTSPIVTNAAGAAAQVNWNNVSAASGTLSGLIDDSGAEVPDLGITYVMPANYDNGAAGSGGDTTLLYGGLEPDTQSFNTNNQIAVTNIPYAEYDLYLYVCSWSDGRDGFFQITEAADSEKGFEAYMDFPGSHVESTGTGVRGTYVRYAGLTLDAVTIQFRSRTTSEPMVAGLQIVESTTTAVDDEYTLPFGDTSLVVEAPGVLENDSSADSAVLVSTSGTAGMVSFSTNGSFSYTAAPGFDGVDTFTYSAVSGTATSAPATVTITVDTIDEIPVAFDDPDYAIDKTFTAALTVSAADGVLSNDVYTGMNDLMAMLVDDAANGTLNLNANGSFDYTPADGWTGIDTFTYKAYTVGATSETATATITVTESVVETVDAISVNFMQGNPASTYTESDDLEGWGYAGVVPVDDWVDADFGTNNIASQTFTNVAGSGLSFTTDMSFTWGTRNSAADNTQRLLNGLVGYQTTGALSITNIPYDSYDLIVYAGSDRDNVYHFTSASVNSTTNWAVQKNTTSFIQAVGTNSASATLNASYFRWDGLSGDHVTISFGEAGSSGNNDVYGFQIVNTGETEPTEGPVVAASVSDGQLIMTWSDGYRYNVLTNSSLTIPNWGVLINTGSPFTNAVGSESKLFYKLEYPSE